MALPNQHRLSRKDSESVFKRGKTVKNSFFFIKFRENDLNHYRLAVIIPLKVSKKSVERNRLKRIVHEIFKHSGVIDFPVDLIFTAAPSIVGKPEKEIKREITDAINKNFVKENF